MPTPQPFQTPTARSPEGPPGDELEALRRELAALRARPPVQVVSMGSPAPESRTAQVLRATPRAVRWGSFLVGLAAVLTSISPMVTAALDVARLRAELADINTKRTTEAADLQGFRQRTQQWQEAEGPRIRTALEELAKLRAEHAALEKQLAKRRR